MQHLQTVFCFFCHVFTFLIFISTFLRRQISPHSLLYANVQQHGSSPCLNYYYFHRGAESLDSPSYHPSTPFLRDTGIGTGTGAEG